MKNLRSKCCKAPVKIEGSGGFPSIDGDLYHVCLKCNMPCDVFFDDKKIDKLEKFSIRQLNRETRRVFESLPCMITLNNKPIAIIYKIGDGI